MEARRLVFRTRLHARVDVSTMRRPVRTSTRRTGAAADISSEIQTVDTRSIRASLPTTELGRLDVQSIYYSARDRDDVQWLRKRHFRCSRHGSTRCCVLDCCRRSIERASSRFRNRLGPVNGYRNVPLLHCKAICESLGQRLILTSWRARMSIGPHAVVEQLKDYFFRY